MARGKAGTVAIVVGAIAVGVLLAYAQGAFDLPGPGLPWHYSYDDAMTDAEQTGSLVVVDIYADWCGPCRMLDEETFTDDDVRERLQDFTLLKIDVDEQPELAAEFGARSVPTSLVLDSGGNVLATAVGFMTAKQYLNFLDGAEGH